MIFNIIAELQSATGRNERIMILRKYHNNVEFKATLNYLLNPFAVSGIAERKLGKLVRVNPDRELESLLEVYDYLRDHNSGTDRDIANIQAFMDRFTSEEQVILFDLFCKTLRLGVAANTINIVFGINFIPQFDCMLAEKYEGDVKGDFTLTTKLDGIRCLAVRNGDVIKLHSRSGQLIEGLTEIEQELLRCSRSSFVLDGELLVSNWQELTSTKGYKATTQIVRRLGEKSGITYQAFDFIRYPRFIEQTTTIPYSARRVELERYFGNMEHIKVLPALYQGRDFSQINQQLNIAIANKQEGIMLNINSAPYEFKRCKSLQKIKKMHDIDLPVVGVEEGSGRLSGTLGRLTILYKGNRVGVGSGFDDETRKLLWLQRARLVGQICTVQYFEETQDALGNPSLRFPVFLRIRKEV